MSGSESSSYHKASGGGAEILDLESVLKLHSLILNDEVFDSNFLGILHENIHVFVSERGDQTIGRNRCQELATDTVNTFPVNKHIGGGFHIRCDFDALVHSEGVLCL